PFAADVMTALFPRSPWDPVSLRYWWSQPDESMEIARFIVLRGERPIGFAHIDHARWDLDPKRYASVWGDLMPAERTGELLRAFLAAMEERLRADGARTIRVRAEEDDAPRIDAILAVGYPTVRGVVGTEWTATARSVRGRGIARALKCETLAQAIALGIDRVRTGNDSANAPILHLNATMGYHLTPASINYLRPV